MRINPREYKAAIDSAFLYHSFSSVLNTAALITLSWFSFSPSSPLSQRHPDPDTLNKIAYPIYIGLLFFPCLILYLNVIPYIKIFTDDDNITLDENTIATHHNKIKTILCEHAEVFHVSATPEIRIVKNNISNAFVSQLSSCTSQHLLLNSGCLISNRNNTLSLKILLAHELMHFKNDLPSLHISQFKSILYSVNILFLFFGYTPLQIGYSIANLATTDFHPAFIYLPLIGLFLMLLNTISFFHENRTRERNADYGALFSGKKFEDDEYANHQRHYRSFSTNNSLFGELFSTHPGCAERIELLNAAKEYVRTYPSNTDVI